MYSFIASVTNILEPTNIGVLSTVKSADENGTTSQYSNDIWKMYTTNSLTENEIRWTDRKVHQTSPVNIYDENYKIIGEEDYYDVTIEIPYYMSDNIEDDYHISITPNTYGNYRVKERNRYYFIVESDVDGFAFTFEVVAKKLDKSNCQNVVVANYGITQEIQTMRKEAGFEVMDKIMVNVANNDKIKAIIEGNLDEIKSEVLADKIEFDKIDGYEKEWNINGEKVTVSVSKNS